MQQKNEDAELLEKIPLVITGYIRFELTGLLPYKGFERIENLKSC